MKSCDIWEQSILVVTTSDRGEKITAPLNEVGIQPAYFVLNSVSDLRDLYRTIERTRPDIIIVDSLGFAGGVVMAASARFSIPYILRIRGDANREHVGWMKTHLKNHDFGRAGKQIPRFVSTVLSLHFADGYLFVSDYLKREYGVSGDDVAVIPTPCMELDNAREGPVLEQEIEGLPDLNDNIVISVMNMNYREKVDGLLDGIDVLSDLLTDRQDTSFLIAGDGAYYDVVESKAQQLQGDIRTLGYVSDIHRLYEMADIFVHFSHLDGYPSTVLESYAYQVPVVANDEVGMSEQIEDGETGLLVNLNDQAGTIGKVESLLDDPELRNELALNGYERVAQNNTKEAVGEKMKSFLSKYAP